MGDDRLLARTLWWNGAVDLACAAVLLVLPLLPMPLLGYARFDAQGVFMAGGWGVSTLALGLVRLWGSSRPQSHPALRLLGLAEAPTLALYCLLHVVYGRVTLLQVLLPLLVGAVFGTLYLRSLRRR